MITLITLVRNYFREGLRGFLPSLMLLIEEATYERAEGAVRLSPLCQCLGLAAAAELALAQTQGMAHLPTHEQPFYGEVSEHQFEAHQEISKCN